MTLTSLKVQLTSYLCEMASTNSYETRDKALALLDVAYNLGVSESKGGGTTTPVRASRPSGGRPPSRD